MTNTNTVEVIHDSSLVSKHLKRKIVLDILLPPHYDPSQKSYKLLLMNDGQDIEQLRLAEVLEKEYAQNSIEPVIVVAIHCSNDRLQEYGTASQADYKKRGSKAGKYTSFIIEELLPYIHYHYRILNGAENHVFCGFSLGGLSAFDIVWSHAHIFSKVGAFSASFWWRQKAYENQYSDELDRIMHNLVKNVGIEQIAHSEMSKLKFWIQTGTNDEAADRNRNGIIDSIDDATDLITELEKKGFQKGRDIRYVEVVGGQHNQKTWSEVMPDFLRWAFPK